MAGVSLIAALAKRCAYFLILSVALQATPARSVCPLELRSYEDVEGLGFVLDLDPPAKPGTTADLAVARLLHREFGEIARFRIVDERVARRTFFVTDEGRHGAFFFARDLHAVGRDDRSHYLFVEGLDLARRLPQREVGDTGSRPEGAVLWQMAGCKE